MDTAYIYKVYYDGSLATPSYEDKFGVLLLRNLPQLIEAVARSRNVWLMQNIDPKNNAPGIDSYLAARGKVVFEGFDQQVVRIQGVPSPR